MQRRLKRKPAVIDPSSSREFAHEHEDQPCVSIQSENRSARGFLTQSGCLSAGDVGRRSRYARPRGLLVAQIIMVV